MYGDNEYEKNSSEEIAVVDELTKDIYENSEGDKKKKIIKLIIIIIAALVLIFILLFIFMPCLFHHEWKEATCESPRTCIVCDKTEGKALGHRWVEADCVTPKTCTVCDKTEGEALGHEWVEATCESPKTCAKCKKTEGEVLNHQIGNTTVVKAATCTAEGTAEGKCKVCNKVLTEAIPAKGHNYGNDYIIKYATPQNPGEKKQTCTACGSEKTIDYELTPEDWANIYVVWTGTLNRYPQKTIFDALEGYFVGGEWITNEDWVAFRGECTWKNEDAVAVFVFDVSDGLELVEISMNGENLGEVWWTKIMDEIYNG